MPPVSEKQRRAMEAAAHGHSTLGIPKSVGEEFVAADATNGIAAGCIFVAPDGRVLLLKRSDAEENYAGHWAFPGGKADGAEDAEAAVKREAREEIGREPGALRLIDSRVTPNGMAFHTFASPAEDAFEPTLNDEHSDHVWASLDDLPEPLHPGVSATLKDRLGIGEDMSPEQWKELRDNFAQWTREDGPEHAQDAMIDRSFALDRASVRRVDQDGHLHVSLTPISKAAVNPYFGREIPGFEKLGLDPDKIYKLLRDPKELEKAAGSFEGKPLLDLHKPLSADEHPHDRTVGSVGNGVVWKPPYLMAPLSVWPSEVIRDIESGRKKELSSAYRYDPDMTPGTHEGQPYDGVMRNIIGNHVALVPEGRAGSDVVVGDAAMKRSWNAMFALDESAEVKARAEGKFTEKDKEAASKHVHHREDMPESAFLEPASRKYPVKEKRDGAWKYDRDLLLAAARDARMHGNDELAARADAIRKREFGTAQDHKPQEGQMAKSPMSRKAVLVKGALMNHLSPRLAQDATIDLNGVLKGVTAKNFADQKAGIISRITKATEGKLAQDADLDDLTSLLDALGDVEEAEDETEANAALPAAKKAEDDEPDIKAKLREMLGDRMSEDELAAMDDMIDSMAPKAMDEDQPKEPKEGAEDEEEKVDKKAMDAAIAAAVKANNDKRDALELAHADVQPYVGKIAVACDSAEDVYRHALKAMKVDVTGVHPSAFRSILKAQHAPSKTRSEPIALDSAQAKSFADRFPNVARIQHA